MNLSFRNKAQVTSGKEDKKTTSVFIKSIRIIGLSSSFVDYTVTKNTDVQLNISPCVYAPSGATGTLYFDFNNTTSHTTVSRSNSIKSFFEDIVLGATLTVTNADYDFKTSSLNGTYTFSYLFNSVVALTGVTVSDISSTITKYYPEIFTSTPTFTLESPIVTYLPEDQIKFVNTLPRGENSFISNGVIKNDIIEYNDNKVKVIKVNVNSITGYEEILIDSTGLTLTDFDFAGLDNINIFNIYRSQK